MGLAEAKNNFSRVTAEVNRTGKPVTILKNNRPWVVIQPAQQSESAVDVAVDFMDAYADVFEELAQPFQTFGGEELYPSAVEKACRYAVGIISGHPFLDGNKRTGAALLGTYLRMCGVGFAPDHAEFLSAMLGMADGSMSYEELVDWVRINVG